MKKTLIGLLVAFALTTGAFAQAQATAEVTATIQATLSITNDANIAFGNLSASSTPIMDPKDVSHTDLGTNYTVGQFTLAGANGAGVSVSYDASVTLGDGSSGTITYTPAVYGHESTQASSSEVTSGSSVTLGGTGEYKLWVGGNLGTLTNQTVGSYSSNASNGSGNFTVSVEYF